MLESILHEYPKIFPKKFISRDLYYNLFGQCSTRCFGSEGLESTCMIPMADNFNHAYIDVTNEMVSIPYQIEGEMEPNYFNKTKFLNDYTPIFKAHGWSDEDI